MSQIVTATSTTTAVVSSLPSGSTVNQSVTFTATVTSTVTGTTHPMGSVTPHPGHNDLVHSGGPERRDGASALRLPNGCRQPFTVTAAYTSSDTNFTSSSGTVSQIVTATSTTTAVVSSLPSGSTVNQTVTFTATVTPAFTGTTSPMGSVTFTQGTTTLCTAVALSGGTAQCAYAFPTDVGSPFTVTAAYTSSGHKFQQQQRHGVADRERDRYGDSRGFISADGFHRQIKQTVTFTATVTSTVTGTTHPMGSVKLHPGHDDHVHSGGAQRRDGTVCLRLSDGCRQPVHSDRGLHPQ